MTVISIQPVAWVERRDTHQLQFEDDGLREGLNPSCGLIQRSAVAAAAHM